MRLRADVIDPHPFDMGSSLRCRFVTLTGTGMSAN